MSRCLCSADRQPPSDSRYYQIHNWVRFVVFGLGTALFLAAGNLLLILSLRQSYRHRKTLLSQRKLREEKRLQVRTLQLARPACIYIAHGA